MRRIHVVLATVFFITCFIAGGAWGQLTAEEIDRLGKDLTPMGAIKAGNAEGTIPAWEGGILEFPAGYTDGGYFVDPFKEDKVQFKITTQNVDEYGDKLTAGHKALLKQYDTFYMNVYPTRRSASYAQVIYDGTRKVAATAELVDDGNGISNSIQGYPFPIPKTGLEVMWNVMIRPHAYPGFFERQHIIAAVTRSGKYDLVRMKDYGFLNYWHEDSTLENLNNMQWMYRREITAPAKMAGGVLLLHETLNQAQSARKAWVYNPGQRRVRRAPEFAFDNPWEGSDGLMTIDQATIFNGSPEKYDWKLIGKKEIYVPYNSYLFNSHELKYKDILTPLHPAPQYMRYELHRVFVVEGTLKEGQRHIYKRRTIYVDEDTWVPVCADLYDNRDQLWRVSEEHSVNYYNVPLVTYAAEIHYDLQVGRYVSAFMHNEEPPWNVGVDFDRKLFSTQALRRSGRR